MIRKKILITGASGEIGSAIAKEFINQNNEVIAPTRREMDLADPKSIAKYINELDTTVDSFIHCAGINFPKQIGELSHDDIQHTMQVNTFSFYDIIYYLLPKLKEKSGSSIVGISSIYGSFSREKRLAYSASKHALNGMIKTLAIELGKYNIKVNGISPGFIETKLTYQNNSQEVIDDFKNRVPIGKLGSPDDVAKLCYFLCSEHNNYINGEIILMDGGYSVGGFQL